MNYQKIYQELINKNKHREIIKENGYEIHHIIPRCVMGSDDKENLVKLTYREHFIAHILLTKIYPDSNKLLYSAWKFTYSRDGHNKTNNSRMHAILKQKYILSRRLILDKCELIKYFSDASKTKLQAAMHFKCNWGTIDKNMKEYGIEYLWDGTYNKKYSKEEIRDILSLHKCFTLSKIAKKYNMSYAQLNDYINIYDLEVFRPARFVENERKLLEYINSGKNDIPRHKLYKEFNMHARKVTSILKEHNINYLCKDEIKRKEYVEKRDNFVIHFFSTIPSGYSKSGFALLFKEDIRTIKKILSKNNIKYNFSYKHHKGEEYNERVFPLIRRGIEEGICFK